MKRLVLFLCCGVIAHARPSHPIQQHVGVIYKGPNSETIIKGPDGSVITAEAAGGLVSVDGNSAIAKIATGNVLASAQVHASGIAKSAVITTGVGSLAQTPIVVAEAPVLGVTQIASEPVVVSNAVVGSAGDAASLEGPSGSILRLGEDAIIAGPASTTIRDGKVIASIPGAGIQTVLAQAPAIQVPVTPTLVEAGLGAAQIGLLSSQGVVGNGGLLATQVQEGLIDDGALRAAQAGLIQQQRIAAQANAAQATWLEEQRIAAQAAQANLLEQERHAVQVNAVRTNLLEQERAALQANAAQANLQAQQRAAQANAAQAYLVEQERAVAQANAAQATSLEQERISALAKAAQENLVEQGRVAAQAQADLVAQERVSAQKIGVLNAAQADLVARERIAAQAQADLDLQERIAAQRASVEEAVQADLQARERQAMLAAQQRAVAQNAAQQQSLANQQAALAQNAAAVNRAANLRVSGSINAVENGVALGGYRHDGVLLTNEAERNALVQAVNSGYLQVGHGLVNGPAYEVVDPGAEVAGLNPVITQGGRLISDGNLISTTLGPQLVNAVVSSTPGPVPGLVLSSTPVPEIGYRQVPTSNVLLSSTVHPELLGNLNGVALQDPRLRGPIIVQPDGVGLGAVGAGGLSVSDVSQWQASVATGRIASGAALTKQVYRGAAH